MDYTPRYTQPFTLTEAIALDIPVISEEISRLRNSIQRLVNTQTTLEKVVNQAGGTDPDLLQAFEENKTVIGSQKERITMLEMALREKGVLSGSHYSTPLVQVASEVPTIHDSTQTVTEDTAGQVMHDADDGVYL